MGTIIAYRGEKVLVDDDMLPVLNNYKWHVNSNYVRGYARGEVVKMHRLIMSAPKGVEVDHINGNPLDNRRENLRLCSHAQNMANRKVNSTSASGYKGVNYDKNMSRRKRWAASIHHEGRRIKIGRYFTKEEAARAYNKVASKLKGDFARLNKVGG